MEAKPRLIAGHGVGLRDRREGQVVRQLAEHQQRLLLHQMEPVQETVALPCGYTYEANAGDGRTFGPELEITAKLSVEWSVAAARAIRMPRSMILPQSSWPRC